MKNKQKTSSYWLEHLRTTGTFRVLACLTLISLVASQGGSIGSLLATSGSITLPIPLVESEND